ncbi:hypothetical protein [Lentzea sp. NBRC 102530]|uniref:hypothetical protein n=1 Tax=Lentzea sp. NBRC 102530 TaxID=3032201 RepID=UPI0024A35F22|nr:hypothetical protein [Lentzea sp. NBRC 102530]GLY48131.1 hypothetical protein Lesp01_17870 [Lentzea sp. NBRC 102530]
MDDLDDELRKLFSDDRLDVHSTPISTESVVAGATRRRHRRTAVAGAFALVALVGAGTGVLQVSRMGQDDSIGALLTTSSSVATTTPPPVSVSTFTSTATVTVNAPTGSGPSGEETKSSGTNTPKSNGTSSPPATPEAQPGRYGTLALGMSEADAVATGSLVGAGTPADPDNKCKNYATKSNSVDDAVVISPERGIVRITLPEYAKTPKNVGKGSKVTEVKTAYANAVQTEVKTTVKMAASPPWSYVFESNGDTVTRVLMRLDANDCATV